jgi:pseudaminic acid biosynthesis-associated methylase
MHVTANTKQVDTWRGEFGRAYTDRNIFDLKQMQEVYAQCWGTTRTAMNERFVGHLARDIRILEVGSNAGNQLLCLQSMGFTNLYGIEPQAYALSQARERVKNVSLLPGDAFDIPFKDGYFDLVFTSGVLIHIAPDDVSRAMTEIYRCSKRWVWGFEYYAAQMTGYSYRGLPDLIWKGDYRGMYQKQFSALRLIDEEQYPYVEEKPNVDVMFMLEKTGALP